MTEKAKLLSSVEKTVLAVVGALVLLHVLFWRMIGASPFVSLALVELTVLAALGWWLWRNYRVVTLRAGKVKAIEDRLEGIVYSLFFPRGFDLLAPLRVDEQDVGWAILRDRSGIQVAMQYVEREGGREVEETDLQRLVQRMNVDDAPKGLCLTTGRFSRQAEDFAKLNNILTRDGAKLLEMIEQAEREQAGTIEHICLNCGSRLVESAEINGLWRCPNPNCRKEFKQDELEDEDAGGRKKGPRDIGVFTVNCYGCNRPVELDTGMSGLMECPYDDCSWIINVDNELLELRGGLDKRVSERLAEIKCPHCERHIKVPADAEGLMECPCEEKWIIDVGAALGERAQTQIAESGPVADSVPAAGGIERPEALEYYPASSTTSEPEPDLEKMSMVEQALYHAKRVNPPDRLSATERPVEKPAETGPVHAPEGELMVDCPGCGAGVPARLESCPVCGGHLDSAPRTAIQPESVSDGGGNNAPAREVVHRHAFLALSTRGLLLFFLLSAGAFLAFVYFLTR